jgi:hypothetical protein
MMTLQEKLNTICNLSPDKVLKVYSGKNGHCCCGCAGKYVYNSEYNGRTNSSEIDNRMITRVINIFKKQRMGDIEFENTFISTAINNRLYIIYWVLPVLARIVRRKAAT